jgi:nucleoside-diphosphate-sugar epimerase
MSCQGQRILIVGKRGFIATSLTAHLRQHGISVEIVGRPEVDFLDDDSITKLVQSGRVWDALVFTPARGGRRTAADDLSVVEDNLHMHRNMLKLLPLVRLSFIFGSGAEFGRHRSIDRVRSSELGDVMPRDPYGLSKAIIALDARNYPKIVNLRLFNCFGVGEAGDRLISATVIRLLQDSVPEVYQDREFDFFWAEDLGRVVMHYLMALREPRIAELPREMNCVYDTKMLLTETVACVARVVGHGEPAQDAYVVNVDGRGLSYSGHPEIPRSIELRGLGQGVAAMVETCVCPNDYSRPAPRVT